MAKNQNSSSIPKKLTFNDFPVPETETANAFASYFHNKIVKLKDGLLIDDNVYNGKHKILVGDRFFMQQVDVANCINTLKPKNCEGFDRIPIRIICDAKKFLLPPLT